MVLFPVATLPGWDLPAPATTSDRRRTDGGDLVASGALVTVEGGRIHVS